MLNVAVFAPMPRASVTTTMAVKPGFFRIIERRNGCPGRGSQRGVVVSLLAPTDEALDLEIDHIVIRVRQIAQFRSPVYSRPCANLSRTSWPDGFPKRPSRTFQTT